MRAVVYERYGSTDRLERREIDKPVVGDTQVLIRVRAASVNASDWESLRGRPLYARLQGPLKPRTRVLGSDVAGTIEAVGDAVTRFGPGDDVFGDIMWSGAGGFAEYVCVSETAPLAHKPAGMTFEEAAAIPQAAVIALQALNRRREIRSGDQVLINGAGGGAGTFAVQLAKSYGAEVTAVDSGHKTDLLRGLGVDDVVDYTVENPTKRGHRYDTILDLAAHRSILTYRRALTPGGAYAVVGGSVSALVQSGVLGPLITKATDKSMGVVMVRPNSEDLTRVVELIDAGSMRPVIDRTYPLDDVGEALRLVGERRALGKVVVTIAQNTR